MNRLLLLALSLLGASLLTSTAAAFSRADNSGHSAQTSAYLAPLVTFASATDSGQVSVHRHARHPLATLDPSTGNPMISDAQGMGAGRLICIVLVLGGGIFYLAHLRKS